MPEIPWGQMREIAARFGHTNVRVVQLRDGFYRVECDCGMRTTRTALEVEAVKTAVRHFDLVVSGKWDQPKFPGGPTYAEALRRELRGREKARRKREAARRENASTRDTPTHSPESILSPDSV